MGFCIVIFLYDETRKWVIRRHPNGMAYVACEDILLYQKIVCECRLYFFNSTAKMLMIYIEFWWIFPTLFSKLIILHMGVITRARLTYERTVRLQYVQLLSLSSLVGRKLIYAIEKIRGVPGSKGKCKAQNLATPIFVMALIRLRVP